MATRKLPLILSGVDLVAGLFVGFPLANAQQSPPSPDLQLRLRNLKGR